MTRPVVVAAVIALLLIGSGGLITNVGPWYRALSKPRWNPPEWLFGPAWAVIISLSAWSGVLAWQGAAAGPQQDRVLLLFAVNIVLHVAWSPLFFNLRRPDWALVEVLLLWLSILALIMGVAPLSRLAAWLLLPYLLWVSFASVLNLVIVRRNRPFPGRGPIGRL